MQQKILSPNTTGMQLITSRCQLACKGMDADCCSSNAIDFVLNGISFCGEIALSYWGPLVTLPYSDTCLIVLSFWINSYWCATVFTSTGMLHTVWVMYLTGDANGAYYQFSQWYESPSFMIWLLYLVGIIYNVWL